MLRRHLGWSAANRSGLVATAAALAAAVVLVACGGTSSTPSGPRPHITVGLAYIPNIQFAPFYLAAARNYYRDAGLDVTLRHHSFTEDEFGALASGKEDLVYAGGDEMLQARDKGIPVVDVATIYRRYPVALMVPASSTIHSAADLRGRSIGTPGPYGETYFGLLALLESAGLRTSDVNVQYIQFTQVAALEGRKVDAVMAYLNNDAVQFQQANFPVRLLSLSDVVPSLPLVANGLGVTESLMRSRPAALKALLQVTMRAIRDTIADPQAALDASKPYVPGLEDPAQASVATAVLRASIPLWQNASGQMGSNDPATWRAMATFMAGHALLSQAVDPSRAFSNAYLG